ncbi:MAG TPA: hypothetical protein VFI24_24365 [Pyrinomonadaceae bacterium]|nr:hypothetical protein [Pyrinomonadaceae bacterium]
MPNPRAKSVFFCLNLWLALLLLFNSVFAQKPQISDLVHRELGSKVSVDDYLGGDFNGDGFADLAINVSVDDARDELQQHGIRYVDVDPRGKTNGRQGPFPEWHHCAAVVFLHGSSKKWDPNSITQKFLIYECFTPFSFIPHGQRIRRGNGSVGPTPKPKGDSVLLHLESGGTLLVYWNGRTYRGFGIRGGD